MRSGRSQQANRSRRPFGRLLRRARCRSGFAGQSGTETARGLCYHPERNSDPLDTVKALGWVILFWGPSDTLEPGGMRCYDMAGWRVGLCRGNAKTNVKTWGSRARAPW